MKLLTALPALLLSSGLLAGPAAAQTIHSERVFGRYQQLVWQDRDGLPANGVGAIVRTPDGYLWLATSEGLVRFDGVRFTTFDTTNTPALKSNNIPSLLVDRAGTLWIGTHAGGVTKYQDGRFTHLSTQDGLSDARARALFEDPAGAIWIGTEGGVNVFRDGRFTVYSTANGLSSNHVFAIAGDQTGAVWMGTLDGLVRFHDGRFTTYKTVDGLPSDAIRALAADRAGGLWVGTDAGLSRYHDGRFTTYGPAQGVRAVGIGAIAEDRTGTIWVGTVLDGLYRFEKGRFTVARARDGLAEDMVQAIHADPEGDIWLGTNATGLLQLKVARLQTYSTRDGLPHDMVRPIHQDASGDIWIGTDAGLARFRNGTFTPYTTPDGRPYSSVTGISEDRSGNLWIHTFRPSASGTVVGLGRRPLDAAAVAAGWSVKPFTAMIEDRGGALWFGTAADGLHRLRGGRTTVYRQQDGLADHHVTRLYEDRDGSVWIATGAGLSRFKDERLTTFTAGDGFAASHSLSFYEDRAGQLWVGTQGGGLHRYKDGRFAAIQSGDGLYDNVAYQILEDDSGNLWMSSNKGIYRASLKELNDFADGRIASVQSFAYGAADGMLSRECNGANPAGLKAADGRLWFPTIRGIVVIDPRKIDQRPPVLQIEEVLVDRVAHSAAAALRLRPGQQNLEVHYTALGSSRAPQAAFKYQMVGLDRDWVEAGTRRTAYFPHLPPGTYTFRVIADNGEGVWNMEGKSLAIEVLPPFYRTWWFNVLAVGSLAGLVLGGARMRIARAEQERLRQETFSRELMSSQEEERRRIAAELHDSLGQSLLIIKNRAALARGDLADSEIVREQLDELSASAAHAIDECREIAYNLRPYQLSRFGLAETLRAMFMRIGEVTGIVASTSIDPFDDALPEDAQINIYRIVQECVNNIIKHSRATEASLIARREGRTITLIIRDNGVGFPAAPPAAVGASPAGGFGLMGIAERARMLGGRIEIDSAAGTTIRITLVATDPGTA